MSLPRVRNTLGCSRKVPHILIDFNQIWSSRQIFGEVPKFKFNKTPSTGSRAVTCGRTEMKKPVDAFRDCTCAPRTRTQKEDTRRYTRDHSLLGWYAVWSTIEYHSCWRILRLHLQGSRDETMIHEDFFFLPNSHNQCWTKLKFAFYANSIQTGQLVIKFWFLFPAISKQNKRELNSINYKHVFYKVCSQSILNTYRVLKKKTSSFN